MVGVLGTISSLQFSSNKRSDMIMEDKFLVLVVIAAILFLPGSDSSPYVISDDRVRSLDITPVLGRGYSIATNAFQSTCLMVDSTTVPSYNYDYYFTDFTNTIDSEVALQGKISGSFGYFGVKGKFNTEYKQTSKFKSNKHIVVSTMRIERYYSSVREEESDLSRDAKMLLDNDDYVGFFKACGPNYVRGIRRAQEVTAIFEFESTSADLAQEFASSFEISGWGSSAGVDISVDSKYKSLAESLRITITGFGLGLSESGSDTLVATSMEEYNSVMKFAFKSMTETENSAQIGMIYGLELVPWVDNPSFQVAAKIHDTEVRFPMPRSIIPRALPNNTNSDSGFNNDKRKDFYCKDSGQQFDKFGYCCEESFMDLGDPPEGDSSASPAQVDTFKRAICKPLRSLDPSIKKNIMALNGEFVALLDSLVRYRLNMLFTLEKCITAVNSLPERFDYYILKAQETVKYDGIIEATYTVAELKIVLDPKGDYGLLKHMGKELDEFMNMYYEPCLSDLFGMNVGTNAGTDPKFFMSEGWYNHESCSKLSCLADNMRWDRETNNGCVPSLITGDSAEDYKTGEDNNQYCQKMVSTDGTKEECTHKSAELESFQADSITCWKQSGKDGKVPSPVYIMDHFCNPVITDDKVNEDTQKEIKQTIEKCNPSTTDNK